jgi:glutamate dehydrogenase (NAD(P)+)
VYGDVAPTAEASFAKIEATMDRLVEAVAATGLPLRVAAQGLADRNALAAAAR